MNRKLIGLAVVAAFIAIPIVMKLSIGQVKKEVDINIVATRKIEPSVLASGNLVFRQEVQLSSELIGKVSEVLVKEGDTVKKNQVLLRLDPSAYLTEVAQQRAVWRNATIAIERAQLKLANQQRILERSKALVNASFIGASKHDEAVFQREVSAVELRASRESLRQAEAALSHANERLGKTEVRAPIAGTVTNVQIKVGETAVASALSMAGSSLVTIADMGSMMADINVDEADIEAVKIDQLARVFPSSNPDTSLTGRVESVSLTPKTGPQGRSYVVKLRLDQPPPSLRTGMTCRSEIVVGNNIPRPVVPLQAILTEPANTVRKIPTSYVFRIADGVVNKREVKLGMADDTNQEVLNGLTVGDQIVSGPARTLNELREHDHIKARRAPQATLAATKAGQL